MEVARDEEQVEEEEKEGSLAVRESENNRTSSIVMRSLGTLGSEAFYDAL